MSKAVARNTPRRCVVTQVLGTELRHVAFLAVDMRKHFLPFVRGAYVRALLAQANCDRYYASIVVPWYRSAVYIRSDVATDDLPDDVLNPFTVQFIPCQRVYINLAIF